MESDMSVRPRQFCELLSLLLRATFGTVWQVRVFTEQKTFSPLHVTVRLILVVNWLDEVTFVQNLLVSLDITCA